MDVKCLEFEMPGKKTIGVVIVLGFYNSTPRQKLQENLAEYILHVAKKSVSHCVNSGCQVLKSANS